LTTKEDEIKKREREFQEEINAKQNSIHQLQMEIQGKEIHLVAESKQKLGIIYINKHNLR
jgi:hypothetical protein